MAPAFRAIGQTATGWNCGLKQFWLKNKRSAVAQVIRTSVHNVVRHKEGFYSKLTVHKPFIKMDEHLAVYHTYKHKHSLTGPHIHTPDTYKCNGSYICNITLYLPVSAATRVVQMWRRSERYGGAVFIWEHMKLLENMSNIFFWIGSGNDMGSCILNQLRFMEKFVWKTREDRGTIIKTRCNQRLYKKVLL